MGDDKFQRQVLAALSSIAAQSSANGSSLTQLLKQRETVAAPAPGAQGHAYVNGMRLDPETGYFVISELAEMYRRTDPGWTAFKRLCVRDVFAAFPNASPPTKNGVTLVEFNCSNAGFKFGQTFDFEGHSIPDVVSCFGHRFDADMETIHPIPGWETEITRAWNLHVAELKREGKTPGVDFSPSA